MIAIEVAMTPGATTNQQKHTDTHDAASSIIQMTWTSSLEVLVQLALHEESS